MRCICCSGQSGRAGLWEDWLKFKTEAKHKRIAAEKAAARKRAARIEKAWAIVMWTTIIVLLVSLAIIGLYVVDAIKNRN